MKLWMIFLGVWLLLTGLTDLLSLSFRYDDEVKGVAAIIAGLFILIRK